MSEQAAVPEDQPADATEKDEAMKPPEEMSEEELRLLADTMPGEGPGDD